MNCTECQWYEKYEGEEEATYSHIKATMICGHKKWAIRPFYRSGTSCCFDGFTPKKPTCKECETCWHSKRNNGTGRLCNQGPCSLPELLKYQPIPDDEAGKVKEEEIQAENPCGNCHYGRKSFRCGLRMDFMSSCFKWKKEPKPPKRKEQKMIKKVRHLMRMLMLISCGIHLWDIFAYINPAAVKVWQWTGVQWNTETPFDPTQKLHLIGMWILIILICCIPIAAIFALHYITKWFFGDK